MGVEGVGSKVATTVPKPVEAKKVEATKVETPPAEVEIAQKKPAEGFDAAKKKLMSVSGRFAPSKTKLAENAELKDLISGQRMAMNAGGVAHSGPTADAKGTKIGESHTHGPDCGCGPTLKDGTLNTASNLGASPGPRAEASDFVGAAKKKLGAKATPEAIEAEAAAQAKKAVETEFGVKVKKGDKEWTAEELSRVHESFSRMPAGDREALKGLDLIRNEKASAKSQADMGNKGTVAGEYMGNTSTTDGKRDKNAAIQLYDAAFPKGDTRKESMHVIIHEAGHAVEGRKTDEASAKYNGALDKSNKANDELNPLIEANSDQWGKKAKGDKQYPYGTTNRAMEDFGRIMNNDKPGMAFLNAQGKVTDAIVKMQKATTPEEVKTAQAELDKAKVTRDAALKGMSGHKKESEAGDWKNATDKQEAAVRAMADANVKYLPLKADTDQKMKDLKAVATVKEVEVGGKKAIETSSNELAAFEKARKAGTKKEEGAVSGYGKSKAPEGYAEAYALYQRDPKKLQEVAPEQYKFFHDKHKSAND